LLRNYSIKQAIEEKIKETGRRERRRKQLLDDLKETRGYFVLNEEALARTLWRTRFGNFMDPSEDRLRHDEQ